MISFAEFEIALLGLLRLARFDAGFAGCFDLSARGARRSFRLAALLLPIVLFLIHLGAKWPEGTDMGRVVFGELISYALGWVSFPLLLFYAGRAIDREARVYGAIAVYNWLSILSVGLQFPIVVAGYYGLDDSLVYGLFWLVIVFVTACEFFAFWRLLDTGIGVIIALVVAEFSLSRILDLVFYGLIHGPMF
ncbi:hypothetical protein [Dongia sp. agr-C8]